MTEPVNITTLNAILSSIESAIFDEIAQNIEQRIKGEWSGSDDDLFKPHSVYVKSTIDEGIQIRAAALWINKISPYTKAAEKQASIHIHKGAPLFNTGICLLLAGDFTGAAQFIDAAGDENERRKPGSARELIIAQGNAEQLLTPIVEWLNNCRIKDYQATTRLTLNKTELTELVYYLSNRTSDAMIFVFALLRIALLRPEPETYALKLQRIRILADLVLVLESNLRLWQGPNKGQLYDRIVQLLKTNKKVKAEFENIHNSYKNINKEDTTALDKWINDETVRFDLSTITTEKAAIILHLSYVIRNSVMHVLEDQLSIFNDTKKWRRLVIFMIIAIRLSKFGANSHINTL